MITKIERIAELEARIEQMQERDLNAQIAIAMYADIQQRLVVSESGRQAEAGKFRDRIQTLDLELRKAQKGLSSGCGCPIGQCQKRRSGTEGCWFQWSEAQVFRRAGEIFQGQIQRYAAHPARLKEAPDVPAQPPQQEAQPALQSNVQPPSGLIAPDSK